MEIEANTVWDQINVDDVIQIISHPSESEPIEINHQANSRTHDAWVRTALSFVGIGLLVLKFSNHAIDVLNGILFCVIGLFILIGSTIRYMHAYKMIRNRVFYPNYLMISIVTLLILSLSTFTICIFSLEMLLPFFTTTVDKTPS